MLILITNDAGEVTDKRQIQSETVYGLNALVEATTETINGERVPKYSSVGDLILTHFEESLASTVEMQYPSPPIQSLLDKKAAVVAEIDAAIAEIRAKGRAAK